MNEDTPKTLVDYLNLLEQPPEPVPVSLWPQTGGWIWLGLAILALLAWGCVRWHRAWRDSLYRRQALREIAIAGQDPAIIATILRRAALAAYPRHDVAGLQGEAWLAFLDETFSGNGFRNGAGSVIVKAPYAPTPEAPGLASLAAKWVRRHRQPDRRATS